MKRWSNVNELCLQEIKPKRNKKMVDGQKPLVNCTKRSGCSPCHYNNNNGSRKFKGQATFLKIRAQKSSKLYLQSVDYIQKSSKNLASQNFD